MLYLFWSLAFNKLCISDAYLSKSKEAHNYIIEDEHIFGAPQIHHLRLNEIICVDNSCWINIKVEGVVAQPHLLSTIICVQTSEKLLLPVPFHEHVHRSVCTRACTLEDGCWSDCEHKLRGTGRIEHTRPWYSDQSRGTRRRSRERAGTRSRLTGSLLLGNFTEFPNNTGRNVWQVSNSCAPARRIYASRSENYTHAN